LLAATAVAAVVLLAAATFCDLKHQQLKRAAATTVVNLFWERNCVLLLSD